MAVFNMLFTLCTLLTVCFSLPLVSNRQISQDVFTCDSSDPLLNSVCQVGLTLINKELSDAGIGIQRDAILFTYTDDEDRKIKTGHSCSVRADVRKQHAKARISTTSKLDLTVGKLTEPFVIGLQLPVSVSAQIDVKQRFGQKFFGKCLHLGSDSYSLKGSVSTIADVIIGISLNPSFGMLDSGDFGLEVRPEVVVLSNLKDLDINFHASGVSPLTPVFTFVRGFSSTILSSVAAVFTGDSASRAIRDSIAFDLGAPILLGIGALPEFVEKAIWGRFLDIAGHRAEKSAKGFGDDIEDRLQEMINRALKVRSDGKRVIAIKKDILDILNSGGTDVLGSIGTGSAILKNAIHAKPLVA